MKLPEGGLYYQPASLWSVGYLTADTSAQTFRFNFNREHFRNATRHPITLNRFAICGVNYPLNIQNIAATLTPNSAESVIFNKARIRISAPFRKNYNRLEMPLAAFSPRATGWCSGNTLSDSSLFGVNYLAYDREMPIPRKSSLELSLGGTSLMRSNYVGNPGNPITFGNAVTPGTDTRPPIAARLFYHEKGGSFSGQSRQAQITIQKNGSLTIVPTPDPYSGIPYALPATTVLVPEAAGNGPQNWPPQSRLSAQAFEQQEGSRGGSSTMQGMGVFIDQIDMDDNIKTQFVTPPWAQPAGPAYKIATLATSIGCRARAVNGPGSNDWWWRPGAPVALVLDTITEALVYDLPEPITLSSGEALNITLLADASGDEAVPISYQVGISFNGYTAIES